MGKDSKHSGIREIWAVVLVVASLLLLLSLISYDPYDVGHVAASGHKTVGNFIGPVGAWIAFFTFQAFGLAAYGLMAVLAVIGATLLLGKELPWRGKLGAGALLLVSLSSLLHVAGLERAQRALNLPDSAGGFLGLIIGGFFQKIVGRPGAILVFGGCYLISLILLINFRPSYWVALTVGRATDFWHRKRSTKSKPSVNDELRDQERALTIKEFQTDRQVAKQEKEARKLATERANGVTANAEDEAARERRPEPKFEDYTVARSQNGGDKKKSSAEDTPSMAQKIAEKLKPKKETAATDAASSDAEAGAATPSIPKPKREKPAPTGPAPVLGSVTAASGEEYVLPPLDMLEQPPLPGKRDVMEDLKASAKVLRETLQEFGIDVESGDVTKGPTVTLFELYPAAGVRVEKISSLSNNVAMAMRAEKVRILAPVPGKGTVGIEVPNSSRTTVYLRDLLESSEWRNASGSIPIALGRDVKGNPIIGDLANMPHLLIAGATGSGKTVCVNAILASLLYRFTAEDLRLVLIDPKMVEMQHYNALPHLIVPVVTEAKKVPLALGWVIREMEKRFQIFAKSGVRNITSFNTRPKKSVKPETETSLDPLVVEDAANEKGDETAKPKAEQELLKIEVPRDFELIIPEKLPFVVVVVDELADLMQTVGKDVELAIARLTALGRAAGIHLVVATQRPSVNVVTGVIKANIPARIAFQVASMQDSRVILDSQGAEKLLGKGDMLYEPGSGKAVRAQGVLVLDREITRIVDFIGGHAKPQFEKELHQKLQKNTSLADAEPSEEDEELVEQCMEVIRQTNRASVSVLQRRLRIGYTRAARIMDLLEERGVVGPNKGAEPREILIDLDGQVPAER